MLDCNQNTILFMQVIQIDLGESDTLTILDGDEDSSAILVTYTGGNTQNQPQYVFTTGTTARLTLDAQGQSPGKGFQILYKQGMLI